MRASDLIGAPVENTDGRVRGRVIDIRTRDERAAEGGRALVVDGFIVGTHGWRLFGYERATERRPVLLRWLVRAVHRNTRYVNRQDVEVGEDTLRLRRDWDRLPRLGEL